MARTAKLYMNRETLAVSLYDGGKEIAYRSVNLWDEKFSLVEYCTAWIVDGRVL